MSLRFGILTVSDRSARGERPDASGPVIHEAITAQGWLVVRQEIVPDEFVTLKDRLAAWCESGDMEIILTTGGTGFSPRDITPEATQAVVERTAPGIAEAMRAESLKITPHAMLSRAAAGIRNRTIIVNLPGSPKAALENLEIIISVLPHAVQLLREHPDSEAGHRLPSTQS
jgi:molybdenum cofactor synthesis domain-containing protein